LKGGNFLPRPFFLCILTPLKQRYDLVTRLIERSNEFSVLLLNCLFNKIEVCLDVRRKVIGTRRRKLHTLTSFPQIIMHDDRMSFGSYCVQFTVLDDDRL
jgi:hypothetical protein